MADHVYHFDLDGTLTETRRSFSTIVQEAAEDRTVDVDAFGTALLEHMESADAPIRMAAEDALPSVSPNRFAGRFRDLELAHTEAIPGALAVLEECEKRGPVGVITNGIGDLQRAKLRHCELARFVDDVVVSGEVGVGKPDPEIYARAERGLPAQERTFVSDSLERDLRPAHERGWKTVYVGDEPSEEPFATHLASIATLFEDYSSESY